ncbi:hypothetical protein EVAR_97979_1 [Eumeta japonica]|uniref:Uncharacterized protein n=1 Tax=Eumeta variegata TaxID=151549 RepID=A0A4C1XFL8_EUMVA|nr:hypothetical protein EVAR_97979_1 [Eumeta japonica]
MTRRADWVAVKRMYVSLIHGRCNSGDVLIPSPTAASGLAGCRSARSTSNVQLCLSFDVATSYKLVCRVTLQETALLRSRYALTMRASERHASFHLAWLARLSETDIKVKGTRPFHSDRNKLSCSKRCFHCANVATHESVKADERAARPMACRYKTGDFPVINYARMQIQETLPSKGGHYSKYCKLSGAQWRGGGGCRSAADGYEIIDLSETDGGRYARRAPRRLAPPCALRAGRFARGCPRVRALRAGLRVRRPRGRNESRQPRLFEDGLSLIKSGVVDRYYWRSERHSIILIYFMFVSSMGNAYNLTFVKCTLHRIVRRQSAGPHARTPLQSAPTVHCGTIAGHARMMVVQYRCSSYNYDRKGRLNYPRKPNLSYNRPFLFGTEWYIIFVRLSSRFDPPCVARGRRRRLGAPIYAKIIARERDNKERPGEPLSLMHSRPARPCWPWEDFTLFEQSNRSIDISMLSIDVSKRSGRVGTDRRPIRFHGPRPLIASRSAATRPSHRFPRRNLVQR